MKFIGGLLRFVMWTVAAVLIVFTVCIGIFAVTSA